MSATDSPKAAAGPSLIPTDLRSRRTSSIFNSTLGQVDREQLAQALDKIHITASHSNSLTTFNEFASPPPSSSYPENKGMTSDLVQNGLSGLYSRFRGAVTGTKDKSAVANKGADQESIDNVSIQSQHTPSKLSLGPLKDEGFSIKSPVQLSGSSSRIQSPTASSFASDAQSQLLRSSKQNSTSNAVTTPATLRSAVSNRPSLTQINKATASSAVVSSLAPVNINAFKEPDGARDIPKIDTASLSAIGGVHEHAANFVFGDARQNRIADSDIAAIGDFELSADSTPRDRVGRSRDVSNGFLGVDGSLDTKKPDGSNRAGSALSSLRAADTSRGLSSSRSRYSDGIKRPAAIERITQSHLPGYQASRTSSTDRSTAETSPINTSAHNSIRHDSFSAPEAPRTGYLGRIRIPGTTMNEGAPEVVSQRLEQMKKQVLSKEFWMKDESCKECFLCGDTFSAFRRKHHCRTCGSIFDSKCTSIISGQRFGVQQGSLRVCKTCLDVINRRHDSSGSEDSGDESALPTFFHSQQAKFDAAKNETQNHNPEPEGEMVDVDDSSRPLATPMMAIPATRRIGDSTNRRSAILEIDAIPQLSRPSSSRSLKALSAAGRPPSSGHKRHHSKHNFLGRFKTTVEERAPFHRGMAEDGYKKSRLPAFHDDNIIDPDLAPYMSDDGSSADEQMSIFATMNSASVMSPTFDNDRVGFGSLLNSGKKHRTRTGDKSISGLSFTNRPLEDAGMSSSMGGLSRSNRRRNLSAASNNFHHTRLSVARPAMAVFPHLGEETAILIGPSSPGPAKMTRSASMRDAKAPAVELNNASLHHVRRLLHQLLEDANIPNVSSWERALIPILLQCTDDVNPDVRHGDDIDIRHYVKLKKIPGGRPGDTAYVSGVVFTKNLALKSMPRSISNPRIVIVSFAIEYARHQHHFMSLEPVIAQEKEFLKNMVNRIASLRPQLLLVQKHISGLALQYLAEANIAVAYNVKPSVIEAVSRCCQTEIISSIDMVALKPVHIGKSAGFDVKTYVHKDIPNKKKTYIYLSGCPKEVGCTIVLRGANMETLSKMKSITEFMVYVVYNLKLETCLMRDEFVLIPSVADNSGSMSPSKRTGSFDDSIATTVDATDGTVTGASEKLVAENVQAAEHIEMPHGSDGQNDQGVLIDTDPSLSNAPLPSKDETLPPSAIPKLVSAHQSHAHASHDDHLPEDVPAPTFYSDMVAKHQTKILSASPFVKFAQPYLLMKAREQERKVTYYKGLRDQDTFEDPTEMEKSEQSFQMILPEMLTQKVTQAPRTLMEAIHAAHDAEYDKALHNYQTQKRQWENYIQANLNLFDPYAHQNITVLYTVVCTATTIPCAGPELLALAFYNEHAAFDPDCTLGQYVEDLCLSVNTICTSNGCERKMSEHHRTYVHGEARITVFVEKSACKIKGLQDSILMWSYCKLCKKETQVMPMSESTWKYSLGKYLELSFWSSELRLRAGYCPHDIHKDHIRYFGYHNVAIRIHYDPIDLLEIIVPRTRVTWKVANDVVLKNKLFNLIEERWNRFMASVTLRITGINTDSVNAEKADACKQEIERLIKRAQEEHVAMIRKLQEKYVESKYYEIIPLNRAVRAMQEKVTEWDDAFASFDANFFPSEKDIRRLAALQLKKMFIDSDHSTTSVVSTEPGDLVSDIDEKSPSASLELSRQSTNISVEDTHDQLTSVVEENQPSAEEASNDNTPQSELPPAASAEPLEFERESISHLDLAYPNPSETDTEPSETPTLTEISSSIEFEDPTTPTASTTTLPLGATLAEKVGRLQRPSLPGSDYGFPHPESSGIPRMSDRGVVRKSGSTTSPPLNRTQSQPAGTIRRLHPGIRAQMKHAEKMASESSSHSAESSRTSSTETVVKLTDKKLSERLGLGTMKGRHKIGSHSLIPRSIQSKRKEAKVSVSTLAKHFEQLSREFEKERMRDKRRRETKATQSRAFPKASSKPVVEVYKDVNEAVEEHEPTHEEEEVRVEPTIPDTEQTSMIDGLADLNIHPMTGDNGPASPTETTITADETATEAETDDNQQISQTGSDDESEVNDADHSLLDDIPSVADITESLTGKSNDLPLEIPKHEKSSLMKMLTNFWAERSASGWTPLDYPMTSGDHIFGDVDVIVREDEPSSLIAFTLQTQDYIDKLADLRANGHTNVRKEEKPISVSDGPHDICEDGINQAEVETSLLRATGTHLAYSFVDRSARMQCKIFYAEQFDAVRRKCGVADRIVESLSRCLKWDSKGGKTKSVFLKTLDDRLVLKSLSPIETAAFLKFAPAYFNIMAEALFHDLPTVIAKMFGFYQITIKNPVTGIEIKWDVLVMENLFYDRKLTRIFDLKGSMRNRKIEATGEKNEVLLDENMVEFIYESPLFTREHSKKLLRAAIFNDTLFLQRNDVMDYSLMVAVDEDKKELVVGIIDVVRTYTWDKKLESWIKDRGFAGGGRNRPTVTSPKEYKNRFREAMNRYILQAPNSWHQYAAIETRPQAQRDLKSEKEDAT